MHYVHICISFRSYAFPSKLWLMIWFFLYINCKDLSSCNSMSFLVGPLKRQTLLLSLTSAELPIQVWISIFKSCSSKENRWIRLICFKITHLNNMRTEFNFKHGREIILKLEHVGHFKGPTKIRLKIKTTTIFAQKRQLALRN